MEIPDSEVPRAVSELMSTITTAMSKDPAVLGDAADTAAVTQSLAAFADILAFKPPELITSLNRMSICQALALALAHGTDDAILTHVTTCISSFMELCRPAVGVLLSQKILKQLRLWMPRASSNACCNIIEILGHVAALDIGIISCKFGPTLILQNLTRCRPVEQSKAMKLVARMACHCDGDHYSGCLPDLIPFLEGNPRLKSDAMSAFCAIVTHAEKPPDEVFPAISRGLAMNSDNNLLTQIIHTCRALAQRPLVSLRLLMMDVDYEKLLLVQPMVARSSDTGRESLLLLLGFLPFVDNPFAALYGLKRHRVHHSAAGALFSKLLPLLERFLQTDLKGREIALLVLHGALSILQRRINRDLYPTLASLCFNADMVPGVLYLAITLGEPSELISSGVFHALKNAQFSASPASEWCATQFAALETKLAGALHASNPQHKCRSLSDVISLVKAKKLTAFAFEAAGLVEVAMTFLRSRDRAAKLHLGVLRGACLGLLGAAPLPEIKSIFPNREPDEFAKARYCYTITCNGEKFSDVSVPLFSSFVALEAWLNQKRDIGLAQLIPKCPELSQSRMESMSLTEQGFLHRHFATPGYQRYSFVLQGKKYCYLDSCYHASTRALPSQDIYRSTVHNVEFVPDTHDVRCSTYAFRAVDVGERLARFLEFAELLHAADPALDLRCRELEERLVPHLRSTFVNIAYFSPLLGIVFEHPYLFSIKIKADLFRLTALNMYSGLSFAHNVLFGKTTQLTNGRSFWSCAVRRGHVLEDGIQLMRDFGPGAMAIDVHFDGEVGSGVGPTHEFCGLLAKELCRKSLNLWRNADTDPNNQYAFTSIGLFPRPNADVELFYVLGLLCGKVISMNMTLSIPLSEEFIRFCGGEDLALSDVDRELAASLMNPADLVDAEIPFTYPGIESLELMPRGKTILVTRTNVKRYIDELTSWTCGEKLASVRERFNAGLFAVIEGGTWARLPPRDRLLLVTGEEAELTVARLQEHVVFSHGYDQKSPQARMLVEVIAEFSAAMQRNWLIFVTGCERLPIGGLGSLAPKITVAQRVPDDPDQDPDDTFPTASVCFHYFKLPAYSSKAMMRRKMIEAFKEGAGFHMS